MSGLKNFWDDDWRKERLAEIRKEKEAERRKHKKINHDNIRSLIQRFKWCPDMPELVLGNYGKDDALYLKKIVAEYGLYGEVYGTDRRRTVVLSKTPLPIYRSEFDPKGLKEDCVEMCDEARQVVEDALTKMDDPFVGQIFREYTSRRPVALTSLEEPGCQNALRDPLEIFEESDRLRRKQAAMQEKVAVKDMWESRKRLPAYGMRSQLVEAISCSSVLVISGETGCGKTTQLPQYILEEEISRGRGATCSIICTQPRRISAISVAQRVAQERGERPGETVGYQIRLESEKSPETRLLFCTTGILLRRLINDPLLDGVSHVFVDEIHERGMNEDFLLIILRDLLLKRPDLHLVLMSATLNAELFANYFGGSPKVHIPGFTYPVQDLYLAEILHKTGIQIPSSGGIHNLEDGESTLGYYPSEEDAQGDRAMLSALRAWTLPGNFGANVELVVEVVSWICKHEPEGAILVFVPGFQAIVNIKRELDGLLSLRGNTRILPVHSQLPTASQREIFTRPPPGIRKIVLATSIAETSITIDDIVYVVDCGMSNQTSYDSVNKLKCLTPQFISKAQAHQRRGRAGRVQPGKCCHLYPKRMHDSFFVGHLEPEILRTPLEELVLAIKSLNLGSVQKFLRKAINPPDLLSIQNALSLLQSIGAVNGEEELTALGQHLALLPVDPCVGKMIIMGAVFGCLYPVLTIAAGLGYKDPFILSIDKRDQANSAKRQFARATLSDHIAIANAFEEWQEAQKSKTGWEFCRKNYLSYQTMKSMSDMRTQFAENLAELGFLNITKWRQRNQATPPPAEYFAELEHEIARHSHHRHSVELLRAVLVAGMYPNVASVVQRRKVFTLKTLDDGKVSLNPSSVLYREKNLVYRWLVFSEKMKTKEVSLNCVSVVTNMSMLLFGGDLDVQPADHYRSILSMQNGKYTFKTTKRDGGLIRQLRDHLHGILKRKIEDPALDMAQAGGPIVEAVQKLLEFQNNDELASNSLVVENNESIRQRGNVGVSNGYDYGYSAVPGSVGVNGYGNNWPKASYRNQGYDTSEDSQGTHYNVQEYGVQYGSGFQQRRTSRQTGGSQVRW